MTIIPLPRAALKAALASLPLPAAPAVGLFD